MVQKLACLTLPFVSFCNFTGALAAQLQEPPILSRTSLLDLNSKKAKTGDGEKRTPFTADSAKRIKQLTAKVILKQIELEKFNLHYLLEAAKQGRWKAWRYSTLQEANGGLNLAGSIISTINRGSKIHHSSKVKLYPQEAANYIPMIGSIIGASAAAAEFSINTYHDLIARKHGFSPKRSINHVYELKAEIEAAMKERDELLGSGPVSEEDLKIYMLEGRVLRNMLDQTLQEFMRYHLRARKLLVFQQMQYLFDLSKYSTSAIGSEFAYLSLHRGQRLWNGKAGLMFAISGQLTMWGPILSRAFAGAVARLDKRQLKVILDEQADKKVETLKSDLGELDRLLTSKPDSLGAIGDLLERQAIFDSHENACTAGILREEKKLAADKLTATQNIAAGLFVGGSKTASGALFMIPGFSPLYNRKNIRSTRVTNHLLFASAVVGLPSTSFSMLDTLRIQIKGEINRQKASKNGALPGQIAVARLRELEQIEANLKKI